MSENKHTSTSAGHGRHSGPHGGPGGAIGRPVEKAKDFKGTLKRLAGYLKPQFWKLTAVFLFAIFATAFTVFAPRISGDAINQLTDGFIAKRIVSGITEAQDSITPMLKEQLEQIDSARAKAQEQAKAAARAALVERGASQEQIAAAEQQAAAAADKAFDENLAKSISQEQLEAMREFVSLPRVSDIPEANEKANVVEQFVTLAKEMPQTNSDNQSLQMSDDDLQKYLVYIRETNGAIPFDAIWKTLLFLLFIYLLSSQFSFLMQYVMSGVAQETVYSLRKDLNEKLTRLPLKYYDNHTTGDVLSRMTNDIDTISGTLQQSLTQLIQSVCQIIGYIIMMLLYSPILTLIVLCTLPLYIGVTMLIATHSQKYYKAQQKHLGALSGAHGGNVYRTCHR
jgi:ATP-binding cassette, subfamily B, multidrug efflux pump